MSEFRTLIEIKECTDCDTEMYRIGELEFTRSGIKKYLENYEAVGFHELVETLAYLSAEVHKVWEEVREIKRKENGEDAKQCQDRTAHLRHQGMRLREKYKDVLEDKEIITGPEGTEEL